MTKLQKLGAKILAVACPFVIWMFVMVGLKYGVEYLAESLWIMTCGISMVCLVAWAMAGAFVWKDGYDH